MKCLCPVGFEGKDCEVNIDDCVNLPCKNNGTCVDLVGTYECTCTRHYSGKHCETSEYFAIHFYASLPLMFYCY
ncbi:Neurogenic locus Notch protein [Blattella germanica]|nr:Neurogenic locus Notch protein [Blattella germanica]